MGVIFPDGACFNPAQGFYYLFLPGRCLWKPITRRRGVPLSEFDFRVEKVCTGKCNLAEPLLRWRRSLRSGAVLVLRHLRRDGAARATGAQHNTQECRRMNQSSAWVYGSNVTAERSRGGSVEPTQLTQCPSVRVTGFKAKDQRQSTQSTALQEGEKLQT